MTMHTSSIRRICSSSYPFAVDNSTSSTVVLVAATSSRISVTVEVVAEGDIAVVLGPRRLWCGDRSPKFSAPKFSRAISLPAVVKALTAKAKSEIKELPRTRNE